MNPTIPNPTIINANLACMDLVELRKFVAYQALACAIDRARAHIRDYVARIG